MLHLARWIVHCDDVVAYVNCLDPGTEPGIVQIEDLSVASLSASRSHCGGDRCWTSCEIL